MSNINKHLAGTKQMEFEFPVERGKVKEFANAICDHNPVYRDTKYARTQGFDDVLMPLTFPATFVFHLDSENAVLEAMLKLGMDPVKSVHGESELIYHRPICTGETLKAEIWLGNIYEKQGSRGGSMTFVEQEIRFFDAKNIPVALCRNIFIERG